MECGRIQEANGQFAAVDGLVGVVPNQLLSQ
jgi:hypothetical protein